MQFINLTIQHKLPLVGFFLYSFVLAIWSLISINDQQTYDSWQIASTGAILIWIVLYLTSSLIYFRSVYLFSTAYLVVLILFHLGLFFQYATGVAKIPEWDGKFGQWIYLSVWHTVLALTSFSSGFSAYCLMRRKIPKFNRFSETSLSLQNLKKLRSIGTGLLIASVLLFLLAIYQLGNILKFSRFELFYGNHDTRAIGVFTMIFPVAILVLFVTATSKRQRLFGYAITGFSFILLLLSGYRSIALFPALAGLIIWTKLGRRVPKILLIGGIIFVLLAIPVIGYMRSLGSYEDISAETIAKSTENANIGSAVNELGRTISILAHTLRIVPTEEPYRFGYSYILNLQRSIPNLGSEQNSEFSRQAAKKDIASRGKEALFELPPSDWAAYQIIPEQFLMGGGTGFSAIAEAYFNFGTPGVIVIFALFGFYLAKLDCALLAEKYPYLIFATLFFCQFLTTVRNELGVFIKPAEYTAIIALLWLLALRLMPRKKNRILVRSSI